MARGRMLNRSICTDEEIDAIITKLGFRAGLFVTWMIPHLDVEGRMIGNPAAVRAQVAPLRIEDFPIELVEQIIQEAHDQGILNWYTVNGKRCIYFPAFAANQIGLRKDREPASSYPPPPDGEDPEGIRQTSGNDPDDCRITSGSDPEDVRLNRKGRESEEESESNSGGADGAPPPDAPAGSPAARAEEARRQFMPGASAQVVAAMVAECPAIDVAEEIRRAMDWTKDNPKRTPKNWSAYVRKWIRRQDGRPEGGSNGSPKPAASPAPKPELSREEKEAANEKIMREQRERLGF